MFNGEIYNHHEIRRRMLVAGRPVHGRGDAAVLPAMYAHHGTAMFAHLDGMFAIALLDARNRRLVLATDRAGKKPLFYGTTPDGVFVFASELSALAQHHDLDLTIDPDAVDEYLSHRVVPAPRTVYRSVRKLPPASILVLDDNGIRTSTYWDVRDHGLDPVVRWDDAVDTIDRLLRAAVERRLESEADVPLGAMLSGGLDSSLVVAMAARMRPEPLDTFSIGFAEAAFDESEHARAVSQFCGTRHHAVAVQPDDALADADAVLAHMGEPYAFPSAIASRRMYQLAAREVTVVLTGDGADEIFGGYRRYDVLRALPEVDPADRHRVDFEALQAGDDLATRYASVLVDGVRPALKEHLYAPAFRSRVTETDPAVHLRRRLGRTDPSRSDLERALQLDFRFWLPDAQLVKIDRMSMASSVEARSPMLDHRLVEYVSTLGPGLRLVPGNEKALLKAVAERYLPASVVHRRKQELAVPLESWLTRLLRDRITSALLAEESLGRGYFDPDRLRSFVQAFRPADAYALWTLYMLERWHTSSARPDAALTAAQPVTTRGSV